MWINGSMCNNDLLVTVNKELYIKYQLTIKIYHLNKANIAAMLKKHCYHSGCETVIKKQRYVYKIPKWNINSLLKYHIIDVKHRQY